MGGGGREHRDSYNKSDRFNKGGFKGGYGKGDRYGGKGGTRIVYDCVALVG